MSWQPFRGDAPKNMTIFSASFPDVSDQWPMKDDAAREIAALDRALKAEPALVPQNRYSEQAFRNRPALAALLDKHTWRTAGPKPRRRVCGGGN